MTRLFDSLHVQRDGDSGGGGVPAPVAPAAPAAPPAPAAAAGAAPAPPQPSDRERQLEAELASARKEAAGYRTGNKGQLAEFAKALNAMIGGQGDQPADPASALKQVQDRLDKSDKELRQFKVDSALGEVYARHGVKPKLTRALLESEGVLSNADPSDGDFGKALNEAVKKLANENPELKLGGGTPPAAGRSGPDLPPGGPGSPPQLTRDELGNMTSAQVAEAYAKGQLNGMLGRKS